MTCWYLLWVLDTFWSLVSPYQCSWDVQRAKENSWVILEDYTEQTFVVCKCYSLPRSLFSGCPMLLFLAISATFRFDSPPASALPSNPCSCLLSSITNWPWWNVSIIPPLSSSSSSTWLMSWAWTWTRELSKPALTVLRIVSRHWCMPWTRAGSWMDYD